MAKLKLYSTILSKLSSLTKRDGNLIISSDSQSLYIDINGERIAITDHVDIDTDTDRLAILSPNPLKTYYVTETNKLWKYKNGEWKQITVNTDDLLCKVDKVDGKSLISDTEIARLADVHNYDDTIVKNDISSHVNNTDIHVTTSDKTTWNAKQNALTKSQLDAVNSGINSTKVSAYDGYSEAISQKYSKPETGVPKTDLGEDVQISLSKADTALQSVNKSDIGLGNVGNFKAVSTVASQGLTNTEKTNARDNLGLGSAATTNSSVYATSSQGNKADTAVQSVKIGTTEYKSGTTVTLPAYPTTLPANGGNASTVNNHIVNADVPSDAVFTDTTYVFNSTYNSVTNKAATMSDINNAVANKYVKPSTGIPASDLANGVIPTVNNATLTIQKNGSTVQTFTSNQATNVTANITVPTKVSELTNDAGYKTTDTNTTYSLTQDATDGHKITLTPSSGTAQTITIPDTTYGIASSTTLGLVKSGTDITVDSSGNVSVNDNSHKHTVSNISDLTATASELNVLDGITATTTELNYVDGVTSNIQTQLNSKSPTGHTHDDRYYTEKEIDSKISDVNNSISSHTGNTSNPHSVTKAQVGLGNVENKSSATIRGEITKSNITNALGYTPYTPNEVDNKLAALETNIDWKESVATYTDIATTYPSPVDGWTVNVKDTDYTYRYNGTSWVAISANAIPKATNNVDGLLSKEDHTNYDDANSKKHTHSNKSVLDGISSTNVSNWNSAKTHADSTHARADATKVEKSTTNGNIKINGTETTVYTHPSGTNPHGTTKSDVGLGNVPNVATNDQTPTYTGATKLANLTSGEKLSIAFGKISKAITDLISHIGNTSNPHGVTKSQVGLGNVENKSSATIRSELTKDNVTSALGYTPPTTNTTYGAATSSALGLVKSGTDITVDSSGNVSVNDDSHNHVISNVDGLQSALDGKAASSHTHNSIIDAGNNSSTTTFAYSKAGLGYSDYTWLAGWNGYELRAVNKNQFATASHTHNYLPLTGGTLTGTVTLNSYFASSKPSGSSASCIRLLPTVPYATIDSTHTDTVYMKALFKWVCTTYPSDSGCIYIGSVNPNSTSLAVMRIYNNADVDSDGYPQYAQCSYIGLNGDITTCGFNNYVWFFRNGIYNNTTYSEATQSKAGLESAADKKKLDGIATGAEVNQNAFSNVIVGSTTVAADSATDTLTLVAGSNITLTPDATNDKITIASKDTVYTHPTYTAKDSGLYKVTVDNTGHVSAATAVTKSDITALGIPASDTNTHYTSKNVVGSSTATSNTTTALTNGNVYLNSVENGSVTSTHKISGSGATTVTTDTSGNIIISSTDTNTTYSAGKGLSLSGTTFNHTNSVSAGTAKGDASKTLTFGGTFTVPTVTYDAQGHITGKGTTTMTMPANPNTDTKNTAGSTDTSSKIFLVGATSQAANPQTYSDNQVYATNGQLNGNSVRIAEKVTLQYDSNTEAINFVFG